NHEGTKIRRYTKNSFLFCTRTRIILRGSSFSSCLRGSGGSIGERGFDALGIDAPDVPRFEVRQPDRPEADADGVAALAVELLHHGVGYRINPRQWILERGHPHRPLTDRDVAA